MRLPQTFCVAWFLPLDPLKLVCHIDTQLRHEIAIAAHPRIAALGQICPQNPAMALLGQIDSLLLEQPDRRVALPIRAAPLCVDQPGRPLLFEEVPVGILIEKLPALGDRGREARRVDPTLWRSGGLPR